MISFIKSRSAMSPCFAILMAMAGWASADVIALDLPPR